MKTQSETRNLFEAREDTSDQVAIVLVLNLIDWEDGAGFLDQSQSKVKSIYTLKAPTLIFNTNALCCRLLPISAYDLKVSHNC